jgi:AraC-like DNA-binding protein
MIYPAEADIVTFLKGLTESLQAYAQANDVRISFSCEVKKLSVHYQPFLLSQSFVHLVCNLINLLPPNSNVKIRLSHECEEQRIKIEVENDSINLIRVNEVCSKTIYSFAGFSLPNGTLYQLFIPLQQINPLTNESLADDGAPNNLPQFYKEVQKRFRTHFTQTEKLIATLEKKQPQEAAFMQKINALIKVNLENENFDTNALCKAMSLSRTQLFRRVKSLIQQAPANHIKFMRLQKSKELLETTDCTISEITFKTGFQSVSHFTKVFKKQYGIVPSVFRQTGKVATNE